MLLIAPAPSYTENCDIGPNIYDYAVEKKMILESASMNLYYCGSCYDEKTGAWDGSKKDPKKIAKAIKANK